MLHVIFLLHDTLLHLVVITTLWLFWELYVDNVFEMKREQLCVTWRRCHRICIEGVWKSLKYILYDSFYHVWDTTHRTPITDVQFVPLATEPDISLIILTLMRILQRNLNRSTFVVWEMWRHHNMCWKWPPFASRQDWARRAIFYKVLARDFGRRARPIWRCLIISYGDIWKGDFTLPFRYPHLPAHVMMSSHFLHSEVSPLQISLQYSH